MISFLALLSFLQLGSAEQQPRVAEYRVVLRTNCGDVVVGLYPDQAPKTVAQFLRLARMGVYDGAYFYRVEPEFLIQLADARDREIPLRPEQIAAIQPIPAEFNPLHHRWGSLSMAHADGKPDSGETSFSILLRDSPHLDEKYTLFGFVEKGDDVLERIRDVECDERNRPRERIVLERAIVLDFASDLEKFQLRPATPPPPKPWVFDLSYSRLAIPIGLFIASIGGYLLANKRQKKWPAGIFLLTALVGFFIFFLQALPRPGSYRWFPVFLFLASLAVFKLMGKFEKN